MDLRTLPASLEYLRDYLQFLSELNPADVNEDTDVTELDEALRVRAAFHGDEWEDQKNDDIAELRKWLEDTPNERAAGSFVLSFLDSFDYDEPSAKGIFEKAKNTRSGFAVTSLQKGESFEDHFGRLDVRLANGVLGEVMVTEWSELLFKQQTADLPWVQCEKAVIDVDIGIWRGKKLVQTGNEPNPFKEVAYFLTDGCVDIVVRVFKKSLKHFDESQMEAFLARMTHTRNE